MTSKTTGSCLALCLALAMVPAAGGHASGRQNDRSAGANVVGHLMPARGAMPLIGVPPAAQAAMRTNAERLWAVVMRNPALNPPVGFNLRPDFIAHGYRLPGKPADMPYTCAASGYLYWYRLFTPGSNQVQPLPVAMEAFFVHANRLSVAFSGRTPWKEDDAGPMFWEPREIRRVGGYPQYENGVIVVTDGSRPVWTPVPRERLLTLELTTQRRTLDKMAPLPGHLPEAVLARAARERANVEQCVRYLEGELTRLSADERRAPGYVTFDPPRSQTGCSYVVDATFRDARKIVAENVAFFDPGLPRTAIQAVLVDFSNFEHFDGRTWEGRAYERLRDGMDYQGLAALLAKREQAHSAGRVSSIARGRRLTCNAPKP